MALRIYNSYTKQKEDFQPRRPDIVDMYNCGPTVYNFNHIGNFRSYVSVDVLRRYLLLRGYKVNHATNITDVEDKIIARSREAGQDIRTFTEPFVRAFLEDLELLRVQDVEHRPRATDSIPEMLEMIKELEEHGHTYDADGNVYFRLKTFTNYGKLSDLDTSNLKTAADGRFEADEYEKDDARDFALWKKTEADEPGWESAWGTGRPGWHLECSAMIRGIYGKDGVDIHLGGIDLLFPHHENEIAQSCCAYPHDNFVRYWMHNEHLLVDGKKMSKSAGNYFTLRDLTREELLEPLVKQGNLPEFFLDLVREGKMPGAIRYLLLSVHYRTKLNFTFDNIRAGASAVDRLQGLVWRLLDITGLSPEDLEAKSAKHKAKPGKRGDNLLPADSEAGKAMAAFIEAMDDDLNTARAFASVFEFLHEINSALKADSLNKKAATRSLQYFHEINRILDLISFEPPPAQDAPEVDSELAAQVEQLIADRAAAKKAKNFAEADRIRDELTAMGIQVIDTPDGATWKQV